MTTSPRPSRSDATQAINGRAAILPSADPLAEFADRDRATRDGIRTVSNRGYTRPDFYPTHGDLLRAELDAYEARYQLMTDMATAVVASGGVLYGLLADACIDAMGPVVETRNRLADWDRRQAAAAQREAYATYEPNLRLVA